MNLLFWRPSKRTQSIIRLLVDERGAWSTRFHGSILDCRHNNGIRVQMMFTPQFPEAMLVVDGNGPWFPTGKDFHAIRKVLRRWLP